METTTIILISATFFLAALLIYFTFSRAPFTLSPKKAVKENNDTTDLDALESELLDISTDTAALRCFIQKVEASIIQQMCDSTAQEVPVNHNPQLQKEILGPLLQLRQLALDNMFILSEMDLAKLLTANNAFLELEKEGGKGRISPTSMASLSTDPFYGSDFSMMGRALGTISMQNGDPAPCRQFMEDHYEGIQFANAFKLLHGTRYWSMPDLARISKFISLEEHTI